jgi:hypothetical protein
MSAKKQGQLLEAFIACFSKFDEMREYKAWDSTVWQLRSGEADKDGRYPWAPLKSSTDASLLEPLYAKLPGRFPALYERLVLTYRWAQVDLGSLRLMPNPPGEDLSGLIEAIQQNNPMGPTLSKAGYIQFGRGPDSNFDPVCFDLKSRKKYNRECKIIMLDHEEILCNYRIKVVSELAPSFEQLVQDTIERAR